MAGKKLSKDEQNLLDESFLLAFMQENRVEMERVLKAGANPALINKQGEPLVFVAAKEGRVADVELLLNHKAPVISSKQEHFLYHLETSSAPFMLDPEKYCLIKRLFLKHSTFKELSTGYKEKTRLFFQHLDDLIEMNSFEMNKQDDEGNTPLHLFIEQGIRPRFLRYWPDLSIQNKAHLTPSKMWKGALPAWVLIYEYLYRKKQAEKETARPNDLKIKEKNGVGGILPVKEFEVDKEMALMEQKAQKIVSQLNKNLPLKKLVIEKLINEKE
ncbi:MAG: hypothetical protein J6V53_03395 [Alphaproteobacteria bacterium]|nr:hypothetical protein [Alphaproteobacteria bacterium]